METVANNKTSPYEKDSKLAWKNKETTTLTHGVKKPQLYRKHVGKCGTYVCESHCAAWILTKSVSSDDQKPFSPPVTPEVSMATVLDLNRVTQSRPWARWQSLRSTFEDWGCILWRIERNLLFTCANVLSGRLGGNDPVGKCLIKAGKVRFPF